MGCSMSFNTVFFDIGSGSGRLCLSVSAFFGCKCKGIEYNDNRYNLSSSCKARLQKEKSLHLAEVVKKCEFDNGPVNSETTSVSNASIVYCFLEGFSPDDLSHVVNVVNNGADVSWFVYIAHPDHDLKWMARLGLDTQKFTFIHSFDVLLEGNDEENFMCNIFKVAQTPVISLPLPIVETFQSSMKRQEYEDLSRIKHFVDIKSIGSTKMTWAQSEMSKNPSLFRHSHFISASKHSILIYADDDRQNVLKLMNLSCNDTIRELVVLGKLGRAHNITKIEGVDLAIVKMKYRKEGNLKKYMAENKRMVYHERLKLCVAVCEAVLEFHDIGFIHGDLKLDNILLGDNGKLILIDFGKAVKIGSTTTCTHNAMHGKDPEVHRMTLHRPNECFIQGGLNNVSTDMFGVVRSLVQLLGGLTGFGEFNDLNLPIGELSTALNTFHKGCPCLEVSLWKCLFVKISQHYVLYGGSTRKEESAGVRNVLNVLCELRESNEPFCNPMEVVSACGIKSFVIPTDKSNFIIQKEVTDDTKFPPDYSYTIQKSTFVELQSIFIWFEPCLDDEAEDETYDVKCKIEGLRNNVLLGEFKIAKGNALKIDGHLLYLYSEGLVKLELVSSTKPCVVCFVQNILSHPPAAGESESGE